MQTMINQLSAVPGVVGSMLCDADGRLLAQAFPPTFEAATLQHAATVLADRSAGLETALGSVGMLDVRCATGRIVVKAVDGYRLLFLCAPTVNMQLLSMSASGVAHRLEKRGPAAVPAAPKVSELYRMVLRVNAAIEESGKDRFKVRGQIALKAGFALDLIDADTPDDPDRLQKLKAAAAVVLGHSI